MIRFFKKKPVYYYEVYTLGKWRVCSQAIYDWYLRHGDPRTVRRIERGPLK